MRTDWRVCRQWQLLLAGIDAVVIAVSVTLALWLRFGPDAGSYFTRNILILGIFVALCFPVFYVVGLYDVGQPTSVARLVGMSAAGTMTALLLLVVASYVRLTSPAGRGVAILLFLFVTLGVSGARLLMLRILKRCPLSRGLLLVEGDPLTDRLVVLIQNNPYLGYRLCGIVGKDEMVEAAGCNGAETIAIQMEAHPAEVSRRLRAARFAGIEVVDAVELYERLTGEIPLDAIDESYLFDASMRPSLFHMHRIKRIFDILVAGVLFVGSCWLWPLIALAIKLDSRGPVFYFQERSGKNGRVFRLMKFRTMQVDAEKERGPVWAQKDDPRVTRIGRILRRLRLDELPQVLNVLSGSMSMVGPRPERPEILRELAGKIPFFHDRLLMKPGITGWAQVNYPYAGSVEDSMRKLQFDLYYLKYMSLRLDLLILLRTVRTVLAGKGQ